MPMYTEEWIELKEFGVVKFGVVCLLIIHLFLQIFPKLLIVYLCTHTKLCTSITTQTRFAPATWHMSQAVTADGVQVTNALRLATLVAAAQAFCQPPLYTHSSAAISYLQIVWSLVLQREYYVFVSQLFVLASHVAHVGCFCCAPSSKHFQPLLLIRSLIQIKSCAAGNLRKWPAGNASLSNLPVWLKTCAGRMQ